MREALNERVMGREKSTNRRWRTSIMMEVKEKRVRIRRNKHKFIQVR